MALVLESHFKHTKYIRAGMPESSDLFLRKYFLYLSGCIAPRDLHESCRIFRCTAQSWFPNQGLSPQPLHCKPDSYPLDHQQSPSVHLYFHIFTCSWHIIIVLHIFLLSWGLEFPRWLSGPLANAGDAGDTDQHLGREDSLEEEMATHSSIRVWEIPWREEPRGLQSMGSQRVGHDRAHTHRISSPRLADPCPAHNARISALRCV